MASYNAEIRISVTGQKELEQLRSSINKVSESIDSLNRTRLKIGGLTESVSAYEEQLTQAAQALNKVQIGSERTTGALQNYVKAQEAVNTVQANRSRLINDETRSLRNLQRQQERNIEIEGRRQKIQSLRLKKQKAEELGTRAESIALGVGFPMMFGAGPGTIAGSLAGSFVGKGFGGQILGGALGQMFDDAGKAAADFARSMREGGDAAGYLTEKLGYLNPETKDLIQNAQQSGQTAEAAAMAQKELANAIGSEAARDLKVYGELWDYVGRQFQKFTLILQARMPGTIAMLAAFVPSIAPVVGLQAPIANTLRVSPKEKPKTIEAEANTKQLQDQLTLARANYQISLQNNSLNNQAYINSKAQAIETEKTAKYNEIIYEFKRKKISEEDKISKILTLEVNTNKQLLDLVKERLQILEQRNQTNLVQLQATQEIGIIKQQIQLAREQYKASNARKASLQAQISIQQALNAQEAISLQLNQELNKQQRFRNENKIKELQAQRDIATANVELAQVQAAQQVQQGQTDLSIQQLSASKKRYENLLELVDLEYQLKELDEGSIYVLKEKLATYEINKKTRKEILNIEKQIELLQNPSQAQEIDSIYKGRLLILEKSLDLDRERTKEALRRAEVEKDLNIFDIKQKSQIAVNEIQGQINKVKTSIQGFSMSESEKERLELKNLQQQRQADLYKNYMKEQDRLEIRMRGAKGNELKGLQEEHRAEKELYLTRQFMLTQLEELENRQLALNEVTRTYGPIIQGIGSAISDAMTVGIQGLIEGTKTVKEIFADFLRSIGNTLMQEGTKMIAMYTQIAAAKFIAGLLGVPFGGGGGNGGAGFAFSGIDLGGGGMALNNSRLFSFADGGIPPVGRPSLVGERGPELFVPRTTGTIIPAGPTANIREVMANGNNNYDNTVPILNMSFETTRFGNIDYVSREQLEAAMMQTRAEATKAGAKRGMTMTLDKLQQSPSTRSRIGLG